MLFEENVTIILPCAGEGKRMNLDYPKELYEIYSGVKLIDFSLEHIKFFLKKYDVGVKIAVVIREGKEPVCEYVQKEIGKSLTFPIFFNHKYREWPGSVYSANKEFSDKNVVLLPDSYLSISKEDMCSNPQGTGVVEEALNLLEERSSVFGILGSNSPDILKNMGAVKLEKEIVSEVVDKPVESFNDFDGFWGMFGFRKSIASDIYSFLVKNVEKKGGELKKERFYPPAYFVLDEYYDLGTYENITNFKKGRSVSACNLKIKG